MKIKNISKEKKLVIILLIILLFLLIIIGVTVGVGTIAKEKTKPKEAADNTNSEKMTITCINEEWHDDVEKTEEVYLENGVLITRTDISKWNKTTPKAETCDYYKTQTTNLNKYNGVSSTVNCNETSGTATTIYTISEIDKKELKLNQTDYLNESNIFDYKSWTIYMSKKGYTCETKE